MSKKILLLFFFFLQSCHQGDAQLEHVISLQDRSGKEILSGGSGIVKHEDYYYIIRDNSLKLYQFGKKFNLKRQLTLFKGSLPKNQEKRKKKKPDLEAALLIPGPLKNKRLLMIPSGSKKNRHRGAVVELGKLGIIDKSLKQVSFKKLYKHLKTKFEKVNIEGAVLIKNQLLLFQRGNSAHSMNAIVYLDFHKINTSSGLKFNKESIIKVTYPDLGMSGDVPLTFTDAYHLKGKNKIIYLAAAEETKDATVDGDVSALNIGFLSIDGKNLGSRQISNKVKLEGIAEKRDENNKFQGLYLISDADSDKKPSDIYYIKRKGI